MSGARQVMEQAARYIADHPWKFQFHENQIPVTARFAGRACALGWIGYFQQGFFRRFINWFSPTSKLDDVAVALGFQNEGDFYFAMNRQCEKHVYRRHWTNDAWSCATTMRELAKERF